jgi:hypothetical protein
MPIRVLALLAVCAVASYWRVLSTFFGVDDFSYVRHTVFPWPGWVEVFALRYFGDHVAFAWHRTLFGLNPEWYHATLLAIHLLNAWLVLTLLPKLGVRRWPDAAIAAFVFVLHPTSYTVMNWTALGFEELSVVALTLVVVHLFVAFLERPRVWLLVAALAAMFIGCGFKNLAILVPAWLAAVAAVVIFDRRPVDATAARGALVRRAALFILPTILVSVWYVLTVTPRMPQFKDPAYQVDLSPLSLLRGFSVLMANLLNPLPLGRIGTMYQESVPTAIAQWGPSARVAFGATIVAIVLAAWTITCWRTRRLVFLAAMLMVMLVGLAPYAILPRHLLDYACWPLPAVAALWGMTIAEAYRYVRERRPGAIDLLSRRPIQAAAALLLVAYAWVNGATLHGSNFFVRQARHAELIDDVVRRAPDGGRIVFVPPSELAYTDTTYGQSISAMHPEKRLRVEFLAAPGAPATPGATGATGESSSAEAADGVVLLALDAVPDETGDAARLYEVDRAQWAASSSVRVQRGRTLIQPFSTGAGSVREVHLLLDAFSDRCALQVDVIRTPSTGASTGAPARVAGGVMRCRGRKVTGYRSLVLDRPLAPNSDYVMQVTATPDAPPPDAIRCGPLAGGTSGTSGTSRVWAPFRFEDEAAASAHVLAMRLISERSR